MIWSLSLMMWHDVTNHPIHQEVQTPFSEVQMITLWRQTSSCLILSKPKRSCHNMEFLQMQWVSKKKSLHRIQVEKMHPKTTWESHKKISWRLSSKTWRTTVLLNKITSFETPLGAWLCHLEVPFLPAGSWGLGGPEKKKKITSQAK